MKKYIAPAIGLLLTTTGFIMGNTAASNDGWEKQQRQYEGAIEWEQKEISEAITAIEFRLQMEKNLIIAKKNATQDANELNRLALRLTSVEEKLKEIAQDGIWLTTTTEKK